VTDRLTKTELAWLLAQEARSAAQKLRQGVGISTQTEPPPPLIEEGSGGVEGTLNRLDEAVSMLATLHGQPVSRGRRGKIDLAALLWEVAPEARVQIEMGEGTSVFGDEGELRRMLHVLLGQSGDPTSSKGTAGVFVRREGDEVKLGATLGPDKPATFETERQWLARMATRYGGRLELDGSMQTLILPADVDLNRREMESLKKELAAAQAQGEAYARELAAVFSRDAPSVVHSSTPPGLSRASHMPASADGLVVLVAAVRAIGAEMRGILSAIGRDIAPLRDREGEAGEIAASVARHVTAASETVSDLTRLGSCPIGELPRHANVADLLRDVLQSDLVRAARHDVRVVVEAPETVEEVTATGALTVLLHALLDHAISASPAGSEVLVTMTEDAGAISIAFDDAGPPLPAPARSGVLSREFEVIAHGRPTGLSLIAAYGIAANLRLPLEIEDGPRGGARVRLTVPRGAVAI
jgi:two-component system, OmpR family, sensor kinase